MKRSRLSRLALIVLTAGLIALGGAAALPAAAAAVPGSFLWALPLNPTLFNDSFHEMARGPDGGVYVCGTQGAPDAADIWVAKYTPAGLEEWTAVWPGPDGLSDYGRGIAVDGDGNAYVCGSTGRFPSSSDSVVLKYDASGALQWASVSDGGEGLRDGAEAIGLDSAGRAYVCGWSETGSAAVDAYTARYSSTDGTQEWETRYTGPLGDTVWSLAVRGDGTSYAAGETEISGSTNALLVKTTAGGVQTWAKTWNGPKDRTDDWEAVALGLAGSIYVAGDTDYFDAADMTVAKYSKNGELLWARVWTTSGAGKDWAEGLAVDRDGNAWVAGFSDLASGFTRAALVKWSATGVRRFVRTIGSAAAPARFYAVVADAGRNAYVGGSIDNGATGGSDLLVAKYTSGGAFSWSSWFDYNGGNDSANELILGDPTTLYAAGMFDINGADTLAALARLER